MELKATFVKALPAQCGEGKNGQWIKQEFILKTSGQFPNEICFALWGEKTDQLNDLREGDEVTVTFELISREYNGRYFTEAKAWKVISGGF